MEGSAEITETKSPVVKLEIDRPQDFKFHLAYDVYSKAWDATSSDTIRLKLNEHFLRRGPSQVVQLIH
jgi:uncharacterized linocin/CFP29 family protein